MKVEGNAGESSLRCAEAMGLRPGDKAAIIGMGGKTALMNALADAMRGERTIYSTTVRILHPGPDVVDGTLQGGEAVPGAGVYLVHGGETAEGKLLAPPEAVLAGYNAPELTQLLECDGSRGLPLKGWAVWEPVVPPYATLTIGVCTLRPVGQPSGPGNTHRPEQFARLTGVMPGQRVTPDAIAAMIAHSQGLFAKARGRRVLFLNQADTPGEMDSALAFARLLPAAFRAGLSRIVCGSVQGMHFEVFTQA